MKMIIRKSKGQIIALVAISLVVLLAIIGLAIDIGIAYGVKAKLNAAVDAAAIAACRAKSSGASNTDASAAATNLFHANFPDGYMGATGANGAPVSDPTTDITIVNGAWVVKVTGSAVPRTYFSRVLGWKNFTVKSEAEATKPALDLALVLDTTSSMSGVFSTVKLRAKDFINKFNETTDRVALVPFATGVGFNSSGNLRDGVEIKTSGMGFNKQTVNSAIDNLTVGGNTASEIGMRVAIDQLNKVSVPAGRRVIVFFSDGAPNTFTGIFPLKSGTASGNLFSETWNPGPPHTLFHPDLTIDGSPTNLGSTLDHVPLEGGGNIMGGKTVPKVSVTGKRSLYNYNYNNPQGLKCDANKAARNMFENIAANARSQGIVDYSLGLGSLLDDPNGDITHDCETWQEMGSTIMKRVANTKDSDTYNSTQPTGLYCHALTIDELGPCFDAIAKAILHLSK